MKRWLKLIAYVAVLAVDGCGGGSDSSTGDSNLRLCQATCALFCPDPKSTPYCSPCSAQDCVNICLGFTDGLTPGCAQCVATGPGHTDPEYYPSCNPVFKSTGSADCAPVCGQGRDAAAK